jgi:hypothetical protein
MQHRAPPPRRAAAQVNLNDIRHHIALTLIGRTVDIMADAKTVAHGIVSAVVNEAGVDKLLVGSAEYGLDQLLTVTPSSLI